MFQASAGRVYRLQAGGLAAAPGWTNIVDNVPGRAADLLLEHSGILTSRSYRIEVTHPPAP